jgi:hypothetical protein
MNLRLANVRLIIEPTTQLVQLRGEMDLFGGPLNQQNFKSVLIGFFSVLKKYFPMIVAYLDGHLKKEDIQNAVDAEAKAHQAVNQ